MLVTLSEWIQDYSRLKRNKLASTVIPEAGIFDGVGAYTVMELFARAGRFYKFFIMIGSNLNFQSFQEYLHFALSMRYLTTPLMWQGFVMHSTHLLHK